MPAPWGHSNANSKKFSALCSEAQNGKKVCALVTTFYTLAIVCTFFHSLNHSTQLNQLQIIGYTDLQHSITCKSPLKSLHYFFNTSLHYDNPRNSMLMEDEHLNEERHNYGYSKKYHYKRRNDGSDEVLH